MSSDSKPVALATLDEIESVEDETSAAENCCFVETKEDLSIEEQKSYSKKEISLLSIVNSSVTNDTKKPIGNNSKDGEIKVEMSENPFRAFYTELNDHEKILENKITYTFESKFHLCSSASSDPFIGILTAKAATYSCCLLKSFLSLSTDEAYSDLSFTPFGKQLLKICKIQASDLRFALSDELMSSWLRDSASHAVGKERNMKKYLTNYLSEYKDECGVRWLFDQCDVCLASCRYVRKPVCCWKRICQNCWNQHVIRTISSETYTKQRYNLRCFGCNCLVPYKQTLTSLEVELIDKLRKIGTEEYVRCPRCLMEYGFDIPAWHKKAMRTKLGGYPFDCKRCRKRFCLICGADAHRKESCQDSFDNGFERWLSQPSQGNPDLPNGRRCPTCKIPIAREGGCPTLDCTCGTKFCYGCGKKIYEFSWLPFRHTSNRNIPFVSCPKLWRNQKLRILAHASVTTGIILGVIPMALILSPIAIPSLLLAKLIVKSKRNRRHYI